MKNKIILRNKVYSDWIIGPIPLNKLAVSDVLFHLTGELSFILHTQGVSCNVATHESDYGLI